MGEMGHGEPTWGPVWEHNCGACRFLSTILSKTVSLANGGFGYEIFDLYVCDVGAGCSDDVARLKSRYGKNAAQVTEVGYASVETLKAIAGDQQYPLNVAAQIVLETARVARTRRHLSRTALCEVCRRNIREGLRFCSGLKGCFMTWLQSEDDRVNDEAHENIGKLLEATKHLRAP